MPDISFNEVLSTAPDRALTARELGQWSEPTRVRARIANAAACSTPLTEDPHADR
ncbi:MAG: hypothetical protein ACYSWX_03570 [Planctomycetota bacterium]|jgi:hypothetical protein